MKYQVKFLVKAVIGVNVEAENDTDAQEKAKLQLKKSSLMNSKYDYVDGKEEIIGFDNMDKWGEINS